MKINVIISDITYMKDTYCVAGYAPFYRKIVRLLINGKHWTEEDLERLQGHSYISITPLEVDEDKMRDYPHKTEDLFIDKSFEVLYKYPSVKEFVRELEPSISPNVKSIFNGNLKNNSYVLPHTKCPSLGAVVIPTYNIKFYKYSEKKL